MYQVRKADMSFKESPDIDLVDADGISIFMFGDDAAYKQRPESTKHYSLAQHIVNTKAQKYQESNSWRKRLWSNPVGSIVVRAMEYYWENLAEEDFSIVDVGSQYGVFSLVLAKYIKTSGHVNKIYAFDCGNAGKLTDRNIKLNQLDNIIKFEYKAVSNVSAPHLVYYDSEHSEDNHIVRRAFVNLPSYIVEGITLDDYFKNNNTSTRNLMIKIDTQGVEPLIFEGMKTILVGIDPPPVIIFEFVPWVCKSIKDPLQFLNSLPEQYTLFDLNPATYDKNGKNMLRHVNKTDFDTFVIEITKKDSQSTDLLLVHEKIIDIASKLE